MEYNFDKLKEPFAANDIEWRIQSADKTRNGEPYAKVLAYVTNRAIQNRLDEVVGPANWKNEFLKGPDGGILCGISIKIDGEWVTKYDGAENTNIEAVKGGLSGAMKRAASTGWGIGRYLYSLEEGWAKISKDGKFFGKTKDGTPFRWDPPTLPAWALPGKKDGESVKRKELKDNPTLSEEDEKKLIEAKLLLEEFVISGKLNDEPSSLKAAKMMLVPEYTDLTRINACIEYCKGIK